VLSHVSQDNAPRMVDVGEKAVSARSATARSIVRLPEEARSLVHEGELFSKKGPVFHTAIIAGTMAVKRTSELIPFCHPIPIEDCAIEIAVREDLTIAVECTVKSHYRTGVEMEALTGASVAALTIYDMCKSASHDIVIERTELLHKAGGKSDVARPAS
jgi:cyclic pyranopterin monophosphate synthase